MDNTEDEYPKLILNTALCQSPATVSKTKKAMNYIHKYMHYRCNQINPSKNGTHHITIIFTNNNLQETGQWTARLGNEEDLKYLIVKILSSKKTKDTYTKISDVTHSILACKNKRYLPDILVMCAHTQRVDNMIDLISACSGLQNRNLKKIGIRKIEFTIMYDEADRNINTIVPLLQDENIMCKNSILKEIHFITATPFEKFWKTLKKEANITRLKSIDRCEQIDRRYDNYESLLQDYRGIDNHKFIFINNNIKCPVLYASLIMHKIKDNNTNCIFAPAGNTTKSHYDMKELFMDK